jgi:hypothetical protein
MSSNGFGGSVELEINPDGTTNIDSVDAELASVAADFNKWRRDQGLSGKVYARGGRKRIHTVSVSDDAYDGLKYLAQAHGTYFGDNVSVSGLLEAIGTFQLRVSAVA